MRFKDSGFGSDFAGGLVDSALELRTAALHEAPARNAFKGSRAQV